MEKMADALWCNNSTDVHCEVDKMKPRSNIIYSKVDGNNDCKSITWTNTCTFSDKYDLLYNSVPYDKDEIK